MLVEGKLTLERKFLNLEHRFHVIRVKAEIMKAIGMENSTAISYIWGDALRTWFRGWRRCWSKYQWTFETTPQERTQIRNASFQRVRLIDSALQIIEVKACFTIDVFVPSESQITFMLHIILDLAEGPVACEWFHICRKTSLNSVSRYICRVTLLLTDYEDSRARGDFKIMNITIIWKPLQIGSTWVHEIRYRFGAAGYKFLMKIADVGFGVMFTISHYNSLYLAPIRVLTYSMIQQLSSSVHLAPVWVNPVADCHRVYSKHGFNTLDSKNPFRGLLFNKWKGTDFITLEEPFQEPQTPPSWAMEKELGWSTKRWSQPITSLRDIFMWKAGQWWTERELYWWDVGKEIYCIPYIQVVVCINQGADLIIRAKSLFDVSYCENLDYKRNFCIPESPCQ